MSDGRTLSEQAQEAARAAEIEALKGRLARERGAVAATEARLAELDHADLIARLGDARRSQMTTAMKSEIISKLGERRYLAIPW
jgi:hypothetical protein